MQHLTVVHLFGTIHFFPATLGSSSLLRNFFKASTDFSLMLVVKEISQWLEEFCPKYWLTKIQESIPPHRLPVLASFNHALHVILEPDNPTFERMQKKELKALYPFL